jgi:hypothetical protein
MDHDGKRFVVHAPRPVPPPVSPIRTPVLPATGRQAALTALKM